MSKEKVEIEGELILSEILKELKEIKAILLKTTVPLISVIAKNGVPKSEKAIEFVNGKAVKPKADKKEKKEGVKVLIVQDILELEKSYKIRNDKGLIGFIGKSTVEKVDMDKKEITFKDNFKWVADKIDWKMEALR